MPGNSFICPNTITVLSSTPAACHLAIQFLCLAAALADAAEQADASILSDHVVDHLGDQHCLADAGAAEEPGFAAALERAQEIDRLDAGLEDLGAHAAPRASGTGRLWIERSSRSPSGGLSSIGSPNTLSIRPNTALPTGTEMGPPVSLTGMPSANADRR